MLFLLKQHVGNLENMFAPVGKYLESSNWLDGTLASRFAAWFSAFTNSKIKRI